MSEVPETPATPAAAPASAFSITLTELRFADPFRWLAAGWRDFRRAPGIGLFYGACFAAMGWLLLKAFQNGPTSRKPALSATVHAGAFWKAFNSSQPIAAKQAP